MDGSSRRPRQTCPSTTSTFTTVRHLSTARPANVQEFDKVNWDAIALAVPTMFALSFFGIIHVPINVPALGIAVQQDDVHINRELFGHGVSNALSGLVGSIQVSAMSM